MPLQKLQMRPGLNREGTDYSNEGGYYDGDKVRFRSGYPEKIGGWSRLSNNSFLGVARAMWNWIDLDGQNNYLGVGTNLKYYIEKSGAYYDVTPIRVTYNHGSTPSTDNCFTTTNGSKVVLVTLAANGATANAFVTFSGVVGFAGIPSADFNQEFQITYLTGNTFTITVATAATSSTTGGGVVIVAAFQINPGLAVYVQGTGWGAGAWGRGTWGSASATTTIGSQLLLWSNDNFGQDLVIAQRGGKPYYWVDSSGVTVRAKALSDLSTTAGFSGAYVPTKVNQILCSPIQRFIVALGANPYSPGDPATAFDPMLVRWSDQSNAYQWVPDIANQSGEFRLTNGSLIMAGRSTRQEILIWTDSAIYSMQYLGSPYVWGFQILMDNISVMSPNSMVTVNNVTYWMGREKFYMYSGRVETLPCALRQYIFDDINKDQSYQIHCGSNESFNEVWWFYCSGSSTTIDKYVIYNYLDRVWYYGSMARTAWLNTGTRRYPMAADYNNRILYHESNVDDASGLTPVAIDSYIQSSDFDIGDGHNFALVWRILPDVNFNGSNVDKPYVTMTVKPRQNSGTPYGAADSPGVTSSDNYSIKGVYNIQQFTGQVYTRLRGRQMAFRIESNSLGVAWQLGTPRLDLRPDGRR